MAATSELQKCDRKWHGVPDEIVQRIGKVAFAHPAAQLLRGLKFVDIGGNTIVKATGEAYFIQDRGGASRTSSLCFDVARLLKLGMRGLDNHLD